MRERAQFAVALTGVLGLVAVTLAAVLTDQGSELTSLLVGGLISVTSLSAGWLFKNGGSA